MYGTSGLSAPLRRRQKLRNLAQSGALLLGIGGILALSAWTIAGVEGVLWTVVGGSLGIALSPRLSPELMMRITGARPIDRMDLGAVYRALDAMCRRAGLERTPRLYYVPSDTLNAFAVGRRDEAVIAVSDAMFRTLTLRELLGVLAHELSHVRNNDLWVMQLADAMSRLTRLMAFAGVAVAVVAFPLVLVDEVEFPGLLVLLLICAPTAANMLQLALSRTREYDADLDAVDLTGDPEGLASALRRIERIARNPWSEVFLPGSRLPEPSLFRSHPPIEERVRRLVSLTGRDGAEGDEAIAALPARFSPTRRRRVWW